MKYFKMRVVADVTVKCPDFMNEEQAKAEFVRAIGTDLDMHGETEESVIDVELGNMEVIDFPVDATDHVIPSNEDFYSLAREIIPDFEGEDGYDWKLAFTAYRLREVMVDKGMSFAWLRSWAEQSDATVVFDELYCVDEDAYFDEVSLFPNASKEHLLHYAYGVWRIPTWALNYIVNGDAEGLSQDEINMIEKALGDSYEVLGPAPHPRGNEPYFCTFPERGKPCMVEDWIVRRAIG